MTQIGLHAFNYVQSYGKVNTSMPNLRNRVLAANYLNIENHSKFTLIGLPKIKFIKYTILFRPIIIRNQ